MTPARPLTLARPDGAGTLTLTEHGAVTEIGPRQPREPTSRHHVRTRHVPAGSTCGDSRMNTRAALGIVVRAGSVLLSTPLVRWAVRPRRSGNGGRPVVSAAGPTPVIPYHPSRLPPGAGPRVVTIAGRSRERVGRGRRGPLAPGRICA